MSQYKTSRFFNYSKHQGTQNLIQNLVDERIRLRGTNIKYIPAQFISDLPMNETDHAYDRFIEVAAYVENYSGHNDFEWQKFGGFQFQDQMTLVLSRRMFNDLMVSLGVNNATPQEDDLIYFEHGDKMFRVTNIMDDENFMQFGSFYTYRLVCTLAAYSGEEVNTGDEEVDDINNMLFDLDEKIKNGGVEHTVKASNNVSNEAEKISINKDSISINGDLDFGD